MRRRPARLAATVAATAALALAAGVVAAAPASARVTPYVLGNSVEEPSPEITVGRIGVSEASGGNLAWLGAAAANTHHPDASRGGRTLAFLRGTYSYSSGERVPVTLVIRRDGRAVLARDGLIGPPDVSPDGRYVVFGQGRSVFRWSRATRTVTRLWTAPRGQQVETVGASPDRTRLLVTTIDLAAAAIWRMRLLRLPTGAVIASRAGGFSDLYARPEWSPGSGAVLVVWHGGSVSPRAVRVSRTGTVSPTALRYPMTSFNWREDGIYALDRIANVVVRTASSTVAPTLAWLRPGPGRVLDSIVLVDARPR